MVIGSAAILLVLLSYLRLFGLRLSAPADSASSKEEEVVAMKQNGWTELGSAIVLTVWAIGAHSMAWSILPA